MARKRPTAYEITRAFPFATTAAAADAVHAETAKEMLAALVECARKWGVPAKRLADAIVEAHEHGCVHCGSHEHVTIVINRVREHAALIGEVCDSCVTARQPQPSSMN